MTNCMPSAKPCATSPPPMENHGSSIAQLFADLDDVMCRKSAEWHQSDEYKAKCEQNQKNLAELLGL